MSLDTRYPLPRPSTGTLSLTLRTKNHLGHKKHERHRKTNTWTGRVPTGIRTKTDTWPRIRERLPRKQKRTPSRSTGLKKNLSTEEERKCTNMSLFSSTPDPPANVKISSHGKSETWPSCPPPSLHWQSVRTSPSSCAFCCMSWENRRPGELEESKTARETESERKATCR